MIYLPFIYFTLLLIWNIRTTHRFGVSSAVISWVDVSAFFSILADHLNLYDEWGVVTYSLTWTGVIMYCILWTLVFIPIIKLDHTNITDYTIQHPLLFKYLCYFLVACVLIYFFSPDVFLNFKEKLVLSSDDAYNMIRDESYETQESKNQFWLWIPMVITSAWPLTLACWFVSITICRQSRILCNLLLFSSAVLLLLQFATGGRGSLVWWLFTFITYFCFFAPLMESKLKKRVVMTGSIAGSVVLLGIFIITVSRFSEQAENATVYSIIGYAGEQLNNFCAALSVVPLWGRYSGQIFPLTNLLLYRQVFDANEYIEHLYDLYDISQMNVFFTIFMRMAFDIGILGVLLFIVIYMIVFNKCVSPKNGQMDFSAIIMLSLLLNIPIRGLFNYPFVTHIQSLYIFLCFGLYILFKYHFITSNSKTT